MQVPAASRVSVLPLTVQTPVVFEVNVTASVELAKALSADGVTPMVWLAGCVKVMVCTANTIGAGATVKLRETPVAAA